jgi:hypothetical protein
MIEDGKCAIWGTPAKVTANGGPLEYDSPRAGGKYRLGAAYNSAISSFDDKFKAKLTTWLLERRSFGEEVPEFATFSEFIDNINRRSILSTSKRLENFYKCLSHFGYRLGDSFLQINHDRVSHDNEDWESSFYITDKFLQFLAFTESASETDFWHLYNYMKQIGLIYSESDANADCSYVYLTPKGVEQIEANNLGELKQAFVAMWFDPSVNAAYESAIAPAIRDSGFDPVRIDRKEHNNKIDDEIIAELRRSRFVIADFTSATHEREGKREAISRGGVYYEAGFAHGMGIPVIWTCREDVIDLVHFDTRQYNHIVWKDADDLRVKLYNRIRATIT